MRARRLTSILFLSSVSVGMVVGHARAQIAGPPANSKPNPPGAQPPGTTPHKPQPPQPTQPAQLPQPIPPGGSPLMGLNPLSPAGGLLGPLQQSYLQDPLLQQQMAVYSTIQQMQLNAQLQAAQQQRNAMVAASLQQSAQQSAAASQSRKEPKPKAEDIEERFAKPDIKRLEDDSEEAAAGRQLRLAKALKADADLAQLNGDRSAASRLRSKIGQRLSDISEKYPKTAAGKEAEKLLDTLYH